MQHHPEASPGPHDAAYLFEDFAVRLGVRDRRDPRSLDVLAALPQADEGVA